MFFVLLCFFIYYVLFFVMFRSFAAFCFLLRSVLCRVQILCRVLFRYVIFVLFRYVILFRFNKMDCTYTLLYIINKGGRKNFLREDVSAVLLDEALSAFENIVIGFHEYKSTTLTPYNREKHHFFIYF